jgi:tRNA(Ile)-lysidine synthase
VRNTILNTFTKEEEESLLHYAYIQNKHREETYKSLLPYLDIYHREGKIYIEDIPISLRESFYYEILHEVMPYHAFSKNFIKEVDKQLSTTHPNINMMIHNYHIIKEYGYIYLTDTLPEGYSYTFDEWVPFTCKYFTLSRTGEMNHGIPLKEEDFPITIRSYKLGDIIKTKGGTKKVRRLFINAKIPSLKRQIYPLLVNKNGEILLIPGIAKNKEYLSTNPDYFVIQ